jgi:di/tricarboxylate transporter
VYDVNTILVAIILVAAMGMFIWGRVRIDVVGIGVLVVLFVLKLISPDQVLYGFANPATVTIASMFVISAGMARTGLVEWAARHLDRLAGRTRGRLVVVLAVTAALLSAFIMNTAIVAIFIPVAMVLSRSRNVAASKVLIPLSFAGQFGGVCTLVGTTTNLIVNTIAIERGLEPFGFFEFLPLGLAMAGAGIVYLVLVGGWLLPSRSAQTEGRDRAALADYFAEMRVTQKSDFIGQKWNEAPVEAENKVKLANLIRRGKAVSKPPHTRIREGDILLLYGHIERLMEVGGRYCLTMGKKTPGGTSVDLKLAEVLIPPGSNLIGRTLESATLFRRHQLTVLAIQRRGQTIRDRLADTRLAEYDTVLLQGHKGNIAYVMNSPNAIVTSELTELHLRKSRAIAAVGVLLMVVVLSTLGVIPIMLAALLGAAAMVFTGCLDIEEAYKAVDWKIIFLLAGMLPLGLAMEEHGAALWLAEHVLEPVAGHGPVLLLAVFYGITAVLTEAMSNKAAAAILAPIAFTTAVSLNIDPRPLLVAITFAASTSFATPIGYVTNTMVFSPGGYRFTDFTKIGVPLNVVFWGLATALIPLIWPF